MKQATIQITFEEEKLRALRRYIAKRDSTLEAELQKAAQRLYEKVVPAAGGTGTAMQIARRGVPAVQRGFLRAVRFRAALSRMAEGLVRRRGISGVRAAAAG